MLMLDTGKIFFHRKFGLRYLIPERCTVVPFYVQHNSTKILAL
jgi:hypothetical protein